MSIRWPKLNRKLHYWGAIVCALPVLVVLISGVLLLLKKESDWIQPPTIRGERAVPTLSFDDILAAARAAPEANIDSWVQIKRLDVRPGKGVVKVQTKDHWEVQLDASSGDILQVAYRRSDIIEALHDGSFFHEQVKLWVFLPAALLLLLLWVTGIYLFVLPMLAKRRNHQSRTQRLAVKNAN